MCRCRQAPDGRRAAQTAARGFRLLLAAGPLSPFHRGYASVDLHSQHRAAQLPYPGQSSARLFGGRLFEPRDCCSLILLLAALRARGTSLIFRELLNY